MKIYHFFLLFIIINSSNLYAQTDLVSKLDTPEGATVYLKLLSENYKEGDEFLLPIFIEKGADVNVINKDQITPLVAMVNANSVEGVRILLSASAKTEMIFPIYYDTPITVAIKNAIIQLQRMTRYQRDKLGENGKKYAIKHYDYKVIVKTLMSAF